jgi:adenylyl-sulfate kinase
MAVLNKDLKSLCIWLTGLPCSGKTTIGKELYTIFKKHTRRVVFFDGDEIRNSISKGIGFSREDRVQHVLKVAQIAKQHIDNGYIVICAFVSPYKNLRKMVEQHFADDRFIKVFVDSPLEVCEKRDVKGMYKKARLGVIKNFTGIDDPYEPPESPDVHLWTAKESKDESLKKLLTFIKQRIY